MHRHSALNSWNQKILQSDIGKCTPYHHAVVAATRAEGVEILFHQSVLHQILPRRPVLGNVAGGRNVIRRHGIAEQRQHSRTLNVADRRRLNGQLRKERRLLDVGGTLAPIIERAAGNRDGVPLRVSVPDVAVNLAEHFRPNGAVHRRHNLFVLRPDVAQIDGRAGAIFPQRFVVQIHVNPAGQRVGHDERRRGEVIRPHQRMHAAFKVPVAGEHRRGHKLVFSDRLGHFFRQRPAVADAGGASVADQVEVNLLQLLKQPGGLQILGHHFRTRREAGLHVGGNLQPALQRLLRHQPRGEHHRRIGCVGAGSDGRDNHGTVAEFRACAVRPHRGRAFQILAAQAETTFLDGRSQNLFERALHG